MLLSLGVLVSAVQQWAVSAVIHTHTSPLLPLKVYCKVQWLLWPVGFSSSLNFPGGMF